MPPPRLPGPWLARFTSIPLRFSLIVLRRTLDVWHARYGPVVQLAPRRVSVNDIAGLRDVFLSASTRRLDREGPIPLLHNYDSENLVSTVDGDEHHERRKILRTLYSATASRSAGLSDAVGRAAEGMLALVSDEKGSASEGVDLKLPLRLALCDIMSHVVYGPANASNTLGDAAQRGLFQKDLDWQDWRMKWSLSAVAALLMPKMTMWLCRRGWAPKGLDRQLQHRPFSDAIGRKALADLQSGARGGDVLDGSLIARLFSEHAEKESSVSVPSLDYILSDSVDHFWAGITTTFDALSALFKTLSAPENKAIQERLRDEIREASAASPSGISADELRRLPVLNAVIRETLRLSPPIPFSLERRVTAREGSIEVHGHSIPAGWVIGAAPEAVHKHTGVFTEVQKWSPERWLKDDGALKDGADNKQASLADMRRHFYAFGSGPRMCIGVNVAWVAMRGIVAGVYSHSETSLGADGKIRFRSLDEIR